MDLREQIGQRLVTGFPGTELTEDFRRMVREYKISNVILFRENITDCAQLKQLCGEIQALVRREATSLRKVRQRKWRSHLIALLAGI